MPVYPDVKTEPEPICICGEFVPLVLTPVSVTVILLIQLGNPVKSIEVPDVDATAVFNVLTALVAVAA